MNFWKLFILGMGLGLFISCSSQQKTSSPSSEKAKEESSENPEPEKAKAPQASLPTQAVPSDKIGESRTQEEENNSYESVAEKNLKIISTRLEELISSAKAVGKKAEDYLANDIFLKANAASIHGDWMTAKVLYKSLLTLVPDEDFIKRKYAESLIRVGQLNEAQTQLEELYKKSKNKNEKVGLILAGVYTALLEKDQARTVYSQILKLNPKNQDACVFLGKSYAQEGKLAQGIKVLSDCERTSPKSGVFSFFQGKMSLEQGENEKALRFFEKSLKLDPSNARAALAVGVLFEEKNNNPKAIQVYKEYLKENPSEPLILNKIIQVLFSLSKNEEVIPYLDSLTQLDPENLNLKVKLGILYTEMENFEKAKEVFISLLERVPNSDKILYYLAAIYQETNDFDKAIDLFSKISPDSSLFHGSNVQIAQMLMTLASNEDGFQETTPLTKKFLDFVQAKGQDFPDIKIQLHVLKANFFENKENTIRAIETLESMKNQKGFDKTHDYYLATLYEKAKRFDEAYSIGMDLLKEDPQNAHAWNFLGYSLLERGKDLDKAFEFIQKAIALKPEDGFIRDSLGWYYYRVGKLDLALKEMQRARKSVTDDVVISKHLAIVYQSLKKYDLAKKYYAEALKNTKVESERLSVLKAMEELSQQRVPASVPISREGGSRSDLPSPPDSEAKN